MTQDASEDVKEYWNRSYLKGYIEPILKSENGEFRLGQMISAAEDLAELENYTAAHIERITRALMHLEPFEYFPKFVASVKRSPCLWVALVHSFSEQIADVDAKLRSKPDQREIQVLDKLCQTYPDLGAARDAAQRAQKMIDTAMNRELALV